MAGKQFFGNPVAVSDLASRILDPLLRKRTGMSVALIQSWEEIVGPRLADRTRPEKVQWPRHRSEGDPHQPAVLVVACEGAAALHVQHETSEILSRVNAFLGFDAIGRIRIVQKPLATMKPRKSLPRALTAPESKRLAGIVGPIEDDALRAALERLGATILGSRK